MSLEAISVIDLDTSQPFMSVVHGKQYDTVRYVEAHLYFSGVKWYVPQSNIYSIVSYRKSDNIGGFYDITESGVIAVSVNTNDRSIIYIALDAQILRTAGETKVEVVFYDTITGGRLSSFSFIVDVEEASVREVDLASNPYFNILAEQIRAVLDAEAKLTGMTAEGNKLAPADDPDVYITGGTGAEDPYVLHIGVPSMPGMTVTASKVAPNADPTAVISGGTQPDEDFNIAFGIPAFPGLTVSDTTLAPGDDASATITGGTATQPYNINFGIPSFPGLIASATQLASNADPTATVTGGTIAGEDYNIAFGIPQGVGITTIASSYGVSMSEDVLPTTWVDRIEDLHVPDGSLQWSRTIVTCNNGASYTNYSKCVQGYPGPPGVSVQETEPDTTTLIWINPDEDQPVVIPEYTADEDAMIHSFSGVILTTVRTIPT